jgi:predicted metal-dependent RNase
LIGCGTRKVNKSNTETQTKTQITVTDSVKIQTKTDSTTEIKSNEFEIVPIDRIKPIIIIDAQGKKTSYLNAKLKYKSEISRNKTLKNESVQSSRKTNIKAEKQTKQAIKQIERKESIITSLWWLWLLIIVLIIYYFKKYFIPFKI